MTPHPRIASWLPLYHDMGLVAALVLPTLGGCEMAFIDPFYWVESPQSLFNVIERERANLVWMPNFAFRHYVRIARLLRSRDLSSVEAWINCSEPCRAADADTFEARFADMGVRGDSVIGCYAMAETVFGVSQGVVGARKVLYAAEDQAPGEPVRPGEKAILSSGPPIPDLEIALFTNEARAADDQYGEIGIRAPFLFAGYGGMTAEQSGLRPDGFFMTGDLGAIRDGELFVFGRLKETIIVNGKNIFAGDVEALVAGVEGLKAGRIVAFGVENPGTGSEDLIVVAERGPSARDEASIVSDVTRLINAAFLVSPRAVAVVAERWLVKTTSGKISRAENRAKYLDGLHAEQGHAP
jgi:acyl-CoA synthetase (AMP-forming)/AMP-acid ligase II